MRGPIVLAARPPAASLVSRSWPLLAAVLLAELGLTVLAVNAPYEPIVVGTVLIAGSLLTAALLLPLPAVEREPLLVLAAAALLIRLLSLWLAHLTAVGPGNPHGFLAPDSFGYDRVGWSLAQHWRHGRSTRLEYQPGGLTLGYHYVVAAVYFLVGHAPLVVKTLNAFLGAALVPLTFVLGRELAGRGAGFFAAFLVALWPPLVISSVQILKDTPIAFLLLVAVLGWVSFARRPRVLALLWALGPVLPLIWLRSYIFAFWMAGVAAAGLLLFAAPRHRLRPLLALALVAAAVWWWTASPRGALWLEGMEMWVPKLSGVGASASSLFAQVRFRSPGELLLFLPLGVAHFILGPLPWRTGLGQWPEAVGVVLRYALLPFAVAGFLHLLKVKRAEVLPIVACGISTTLLYAAAFRGGIPRHLVQFTPYFLIFAAAGRHRWPDWPLPLALGGTAFLGSALWITWG